GLGRIVLTTYNPFEQPLSRFPGRSAILLDSIGQEGPTTTRNFLASSIEGAWAESMASSASASPVVGSVRNDPFSVALPPAEKVFGILLIYLVLAVPVNFLVLRKLGRGEWAWFSAPILSLAFAGILFGTAKSLYSANLSVASQGMLVLQDGFGEGMFIGSTQMFLPHGGSYNLKMHGVDSISSSSDGPYRTEWTRASSPRFADLQPIDAGEVLVPEMRAANLAFRELHYRQRVSAPGWFALRKLPQGKVFVRNASPYTIEGAAVVLGFSRVDLGRLPPGQSRTVDASDPLKEHSGIFGPKDVRNVTGPTGGVALIGRVPGFRPGPLVGQEVASRKKVEIVVFSTGVGQ
ncbi:MAG TPA: hypothetical protein VGE01_05325, partial [Fimbriimonas sp.]